MQIKSIYFLLYLILLNWSRSHICYLFHTYDDIIFIHSFHSLHSSIGVNFFLIASKERVKVTFKKYFQSHCDVEYTNLNILSILNCERSYYNFICYLFHAYDDIIFIHSLHSSIRVNFLLVASCKERVKVTFKKYFQSHSFMNSWNYYDEKYFITDRIIIF